MDPGRGPGTDTAWEEAPLLDEIAVTAGYRATLLNLGLAGIRYHRLDEYVRARGGDLANRLGVSPEGLEHILVVFLDETKAVAVARRQRLDERAGTEYHSDAHIFTGTAIGLADLLQDWQAAGLTGFRLRPAALPHDLTQITGRLVPELRRRCLFRVRYEAETLRGRLGLARPASRYAAA